MLALPSHKHLKGLEVKSDDVAGVAMCCWLCAHREEDIQLLGAVFCLKIFFHFS